MGFDFRFGLKLWSINNNYIKAALRLYDEGVFHYIELYIVPDSYDEYLYFWNKLEIPYIIHAPHYGSGMNLAKREKKDNNIKLSKETKKWADALKAKYIIYHPGINGDIKETVSQLNDIYDDRILIENKPYYAIYDDSICNGNSPEEILFILKNVEIGFCLDIAHAIYSANAYKKIITHYIEEFIKLNPKIYHLSDGNYDGLYDKHFNLGEGDFPINRILKIIPTRSCLTIEVPKKSIYDLDDFKQNVDTLNNISY